MADIKFDIKEYVRERDKALLSFDVNVFRKFCEKHQHLYGQLIPKDDEFLMASMMKGVVAITNASFEKKIHAMAWLLSHGYIA